LPQLDPHRFRCPGRLLVYNGRLDLQNACPGGLGPENRAQASPCQEDQESQLRMAISHEETPSFLGREGQRPMGRVDRRGFKG